MRPNESATSAAAPALRVERLSKQFGRTQAVDRLTLDVTEGSLTVLLGPAGAGKTTTLRLIAGLDLPDQGRILVGGRDVGVKEPKDRDVAMIFDNLALYPNRTGYENIASPLAIRGESKSDIEAKVKSVAATLRIAHVLKRLPKTMSGGERQRVALGRALVRKPRLFLLDEPLSSLDAMLRIQLRAELKRLQREQGRSFLYATPDFAEALAVADKVVMLQRGRVVQVADPQVLYDAPVNRDVARFVGAPEINILPVRCELPAPGVLQIAGGTIVLPPHRAAAIATAEGLEAGVRPEHLRLTDPERAAIRGSVVDVEPLGLKSVITLRNAEADVRAVTDTVTARAFKGETIGFDVAVDLLMVFDRQTGMRIT